MWGEPLSADFINDLNPVQQEAVRHGDGPLLVLAGAGSGKTRVLTYRIAYLVSDLGVGPRRILAVTFTNKAAQEMKRRVERLIGGEAGAAWIGTFHSICARMLRFEARWGWWSPGFSIYDETDQLELLKECMARAGVSASAFAPKAILSAISHAKDRLLSADAFRSRAGGYFEECVSKVYSEYERGLMDNNAFDFDDLIMVTVELLRRNAPVLKSYSERFEHVLVDEYQDTSHAQYELVNLLSSHHRNVCVVGDDDQSIYGWRGADITNILDFEKDHPDARVLRLEQNYRSTGNILAAAHDVVSRNTRRKEKELWTEREDGGPICLVRASNEYDEADSIRDRIVELVSDEGHAYHDFAVLYRTHAQSRVIEDSLRRAGIPYDIVGGVRFYERAEVKDVLAYARVVVNPSDSVSLRRIINVPPRRVGDRTVERLAGFASSRKISLLETLGRLDEVDGLPRQARDSLGALKGLVDRGRQRAEGATADRVLSGLISDSGYLEWLGRRDSEDASQRLANVEELVSAASEFVETSGEESLSAFLEQVSLLTNIDRWEDGLNAVSLMTLHNAKGLEFPVVLIPGLEDGLLPHESSFADDEELEEERRLLYVGMTRAMDELRLLAADTRRRGGLVDARAGSRFLDEIDPGRLQVPSRPARRGRWRRRAQRGAALSRTFPEYEDFSQEIPEFGPGTHVSHEKWGEGVVIELSGVGSDAVASVRFAGDVVKRIMVRYGKLRVLSE